MMQQNINAKNLFKNPINCNNLQYKINKKLFIWLKSNDTKYEYQIN